LLIDVRSCIFKVACVINYKSGSKRENMTFAKAFCESYDEDHVHNVKTANRFI